MIVKLQMMRANGSVVIEEMFNVADPTLRWVAGLGCEIVDPSFPEPISEVEIGINPNSTPHAQERLANLTLGRKIAAMVQDLFMGPGSAYTKHTMSYGDGKQVILYLATPEVSKVFDAAGAKAFHTESYTNSLDRPKQ